MTSMSTPRSESSWSDWGPEQKRKLLAALAALERERAEGVRYGERVGPNTYRRTENGVPVSTLLVGSVVYEVVGVDIVDLV